MTMSRSFERIYPLIFGLAGGLISYFFGITLPAEEARLTALLSASISTSAILVGFLATTKAILMALPASAIKEDLKNSGELSCLSGYLGSSMTSNLIFCLLNIAVFFVPADAVGVFLPIVWFTLGIFSLLSFWRVGQIMVLILRLV